MSDKFKIKSWLGVAGGLLLASMGTSAMAAPTVSDNELFNTSDDPVSIVGDAAAAQADTTLLTGDLYISTTGAFGGFDVNDGLRDEDVFSFYLDTNGAFEATITYTSGGFNADPYIGLFKETAPNEYRLAAANVNVPGNNVQTFSWDPGSPTLGNTAGGSHGAGNYFLVVSQVNNIPRGGGSGTQLLDNTADGSIWSQMATPLTGDAGSYSIVVSGIDTAPASAVPVPAAVWLFGSGLMGLVGVARRRKA